MSAYLPHRARLRTSLALFDLLSLAAATRLAYWLRFEGISLGDKWHQLLATPGLLAWGITAAVLLTTAAELYEPEVLYRRREVIVRVFVMVSFWTMALVLASFLKPSWAVGRGVLFVTATLWGTLLILGRWFMTSRMRRRTGTEALVVGDAVAVAEFCDALAERPSAPWRGVAASGLRPQDIAPAIERIQASMVILASGEGDPMEMGAGLAQLHFSGVPVVAASEIWAWLEERLPLEALSPAIFLHQPGFGAVHWTLFNRITRIADVVLALMILVISAPILLLAALLIRIVDGAPVLYRQRRLGQFGREFTMYKLRTMYRDAEPNGPEFAAEKDPRIFPFGDLLRRFRIDEFPQLINVLKGEMSLVGPRPERPEFVSQLTEEIPYFAFRMAVPPGITGWAQVNNTYARDVDDHRRKLEFDLYFIRERSPRLYLLTLLRTVSAALVGVRR